MTKPLNLNSQKDRNIYIESNEEKLLRLKKSYNKANEEFKAIDLKYKDKEITGLDAYRYNQLADKMRKLNNEHFFASHGTWLSTKESW
jgi:hypothetical protein